MIDEKSHFARIVVEVGGGQVRLTKRCSRDSESPNGVGLAVGPRSLAGVRHHFRWHSDQSLAGRQHVAFELTGQVATILDGPGPIWSELVSPPHQVEVVCAAGRSSDAPAWWGSSCVLLLAVAAQCGPLRGSSRCRG